MISTLQMLNKKETKKLWLCWQLNMPRGMWQILGDTRYLWYQCQYVWYQIPWYQILVSVHVIPDTLIPVSVCVIPDTVIPDISVSTCDTLIPVVQGNVRYLESAVRWPMTFKIHSVLTWFYHSDSQLTNIIHHRSAMISANCTIDGYLSSLCHE